MRADLRRYLCEQLEEEYEDVAVQMENVVQSFEILQDEIGFALEDLEEELDRIREHLNRCSYLSAAYDGLTEALPAPSDKLLSIRLHADVPTAASEAAVL